MKKVCFLILFLLILCSGCSVEYNLTINDDLSINEEIIALENQEFYDQYHKSTISRVIDLVMSSNKEYLNENDYDIEEIIDENSGVRLTRSFWDFDEYYNISEFDTQLFSKFDYKSTEDIIILDAEGIISKEFDLIEKYVIDNAKINIKVPFKVINNNADNYDWITNTYSWKIDEETDYKKIHLEFDTSNKVINYESIITSLVIGFTLIIILLIIGYVLYKKRKNNKI